MQGQIGHPYAQLHLQLLVPAGPAYCILFGEGAHVGLHAGPRGQRWLPRPGWRKSPEAAWGSVASCGVAEVPSCQCTPWHLLIGLGRMNGQRTFYLGWARTESFLVLTLQTRIPKLPNWVSPTIPLFSSLGCSSPDCPTSWRVRSCCTVTWDGSSPDRCAWAHHQPEGVNGQPMAWPKKSIHTCTVSEAKCFFTR